MYERARFNSINIHQSVSKTTHDITHNTAKNLGCSNDILVHIYCTCTINHAYIHHTAMIYLLFTV